MYQVSHIITSHRLIIVYNLGGTFDLSLLSIDNSIFEVLTKAGGAHLRGEDFDSRVMDHMIKSYKLKKAGTDVSNNLRAFGKLKQQAISALSIQSSLASIHSLTRPPSSLPK